MKFKFESYGYMRFVYMVGLFSAVFLPMSFQFFGWYSLIIGLLMAVVLGLLGDTRKDGVFAGGFYGFVLGWIYMAFNYHGPTHVIAIIKNHVFYFVLIGLCSAFCGGLLGFVGASLKKKKR